MGEEQKDSIARNLPAQWYGMKNYLGHPTSIHTTGATPLGGPAAAVASGSGGATGATGGTTGSAQAGSSFSPSPGGMKSGSSFLSSLGKGLQYGGLGVSGFDALSGLRGASGAAVPKAAQGAGEGLVRFTPEGTTTEFLVNAPAGLTSGASEGTSQAATQGATKAAEEAGSLAPSAAGAIAGGILAGADQIGAMIDRTIGGGPNTKMAIDASATMSPKVADFLSGEASKIGSIGGPSIEPAIGGLASAALGPLGILPVLFGSQFMGDIIGKIAGLFSGPPAFTFPQQTWNQLSGEVKKALPKTLQVPENASPEQKAQIEETNKLINSMGYFTGDYGGGLPSRLINLGRQSEQSWNHELSHYNDLINSTFKKLAPMYEQSKKTIQELSTPATAKVDKRGDKAPLQTMESASRKTPMQAGFYRGKQKEEQEA